MDPLPELNPNPNPGYKASVSKYKRWTPHMDNVLIGLLSDVVHQSEQNAILDKKGWRYICSNLRQTDPASVYSTYTKYSCKQHLLHVINHRYKVWHCLMVFLALNQGPQYRYKWNCEMGRFQVFELRTSVPVVDEEMIKMILVDSSKLHLPVLVNVHRGPLIVSELFLTSNMRYMSLYHNEVSLLLAKTNPNVFQGGEDRVPLLDLPERPYGFALKPASSVIGQVPRKNVEKKSPPAHDLNSGYAKDGVWLRRLISLERMNLLSSQEVLQICDGVRDGNIPPFMLNILDPSYTGETVPVLSEEETAKEIRDFILPMVRPKVLDSA